MHLLLFLWWSYWNSLCFGESRAFTDLRLVNTHSHSVGISLSLVLGCTNVFYILIHYCSSLFLCDLASFWYQGHAALHLFNPKIFFKNVLWVLWIHWSKITNTGTLILKPNSGLSWGVLEVSFCLSPRHPICHLFFPAPHISEPQILPLSTKCGI